MEKTVFFEGLEYPKVDITNVVLALWDYCTELQCGRKYGQFSLEPYDLGAKAVFANRCSFNELELEQLMAWAKRLGFCFEIGFSHSTLKLFLILELPQSV